MNKRIIVVLSLVLIAIFSLSSCDLIVKDPEVDKKTIIIEIGEDKITKEEVTASVDQIKLYYQLQYRNSIDLNSEEYKESILNSAIDNLIAKKVIDNKLNELGFNELSENDLEALKSEAESDYTSSLESLKAIYFAESELEGEELNKAVAAKAEELGYNNVEKIIENKSESKKLDNLRNSIIKDIIVSEEDIKAEYDAKVTQSRINVENMPELYSSYIMNGNPVYYVPAGYRSVKQILVKFTDDDTKKINSLFSSLVEKQSQIDTVKKSIEEEQSSPAENTEEQSSDTSRIDSLNTSLKQYETELSALQSELDSAKEKAYNNIQDKLDKVTAALADSTKSFESIMDEFNEDPGMKQDRFKNDGYPVSAVSNTFDKNFLDAAIALKNIGDISEPVKGQYGYYIIKYNGDIKEGAVEYDSVKDDIQKTLLEKKQNDEYNNQIQKWIDEANAKIHLDRMK